MILELDCGNSYVKWRVVAEGSNFPPCGGVVNAVPDLLDELRSRESVVAIDRCRMASVRSAEETQKIIDALTDSLHVEIHLASPVGSAGGVANGYREHQRLGVDRWLAMLGAYDMCKGACLVIDLGTAITVDLISESGLHLGGYIAPGASLLRSQLLTHARRVRYDSAESALALKDLSPGRSTAEAVERGCLIMVRSYIAAQIEYAETVLGGEFTTLVTGGDFALTKDIPSALCVPDLVFRGLAMACP